MTGFFWISANSDPASALSVTVQAEDANGGFIMEPKQITVSAGYANTFTNGAFSNASPATNSNVTALDVLFAAHADKYGTAFTSSTYTNYIGGSASYITEMFDIEAGSGYGFPAIMFVVNGVQPNDGIVQNWPGWGDNPPSQGYMTYAINQSIIQDGDVVNFFFINSYNDLYTYIEQTYVEDDETYTQSFLDFNPVTKIFNSTETILLKGYDVFSEGYLVQTSWHIVPLGNARICKVSDNSVVGTATSTGSIDLSTLTIPTGTTALTVKPAVGDNTHIFIPIYFIVNKAS
jgi:hypothetical protein